MLSMPRISSGLLDEEGHHPQCVVFMATGQRNNPFRQLQVEGSRQYLLPIETQNKIPVSQAGVVFAKQGQGALCSVT